MTDPTTRATAALCGHRNVTGTFDGAGHHLANRCDDCGHTVTWQDDDDA